MFQITHVCRFSQQRFCKTKRRNEFNGLHQVTAGEGQAKFSTNDQIRVTKLVFVFHSISIYYFSLDLTVFISHSFSLTPFWCWKINIFFFARVFNRTSHHRSIHSVLIAYCNRLFFTVCLTIVYSLRVYYTPHLFFSLVLLLLLLLKPFVHLFT